MSVAIDMLPAAHGDCLWIEWRSDDEPETTRRMLIDGGPAHTYPRLLERIAALAPDDRRFELLIVTHIDADHIDGIVRLLRDVEQLGVVFGQVWFNGREQLDNLPDRPGDALGAVSGEYLQILLHDLEDRVGDVWNVGFDRGIVYCDPTTGRFPKVQFPGGLTLTVVSPDIDRLHELDEEWEAELKRLKVDVGRPDELRARLDRDRRLKPLADELGGPAPAMAGDDLSDLDDLDDLDGAGRGEDVGDRFRFDELPPAPGVELEVPLPDELGGGEPGEDKPFGSDDSPANGSSIAVLAEWDDGTTALLTGDAFAGVLQTSIEHLVGPGKRLALDVFKVPHHGSVSNVTEELLGVLKSRAYMISTSGVVFGHPHRRAVELIAEQHGRGKPRFVFDYRSPTTEGYASEVIAGRKCIVSYPEGNGLSF